MCAFSQADRVTLPIDDGRSASAAALNQISVSLIVPAFNEDSILKENLERLHDYMSSLLPDEDWEIIVVDDGSKDRSGLLAEEFAKLHRNVSVQHHVRNYGLGRALRTGFAAARGEVVIPVDVDLSYSPEHIGALLKARTQTSADLVLLSPYMLAGSVSNVPFIRLLFSRSANRCLSFANGANLRTFTGMVRLYSSKLLSKLPPLSSDGMEINLEVLHKALLSGARVKEIPAHLDWEHRIQPAKPGLKLTFPRLSGRRLCRQVRLVLVYSLHFARVRRLMVEAVIK